MVTPEQQQAAQEFLKSSGHVPRTGPAPKSAPTDWFSAVQAQVGTNPAPTGRPYGDIVKEQALGGGNEIIKGVEDASKILQEPAAKTLPEEVSKGARLAGKGIDVGLSGIGVLFSPVSALIQKISESASDNPEVQKFAQEISPALDVANAGSMKLTELAQKHPDLAKNIERMVSLLTLEGGEKSARVGVEKAGDVIKDVSENMNKAPEPSVEPVQPEVDKTPSAIPTVGAQLARNVWGNVKNFVNDLRETGIQRAALEGEKGKTAVRVLDETGSPEFVNLVDKTASPEDLAAKRKMLDVASDRLEGRASDKLPRQVVADEYIVPRVDTLRTRLQDLGKTIGKAKDDTKVVDTSDLVDSMIAEARKQGIVVTKNKGGFNFKKAPGVSGIDTARINSVKSMFDGFRPDKEGNFTNTIAQLAATRKNLSDLTKRSDAAKEVVSPGGPIDGARRLIAQKIGSDYYQATRDYSDIARVLEQLDPDLKVRLSEDSTKEIANIKLGDYARRLLSNNASQAKSVFKSLDELYAKESARTGKTVPKQDLADLVDFAGSIEEGLGITPRNSFFGQTSGGMSDALGKVPTSIGEAAGSIKNIATKSNRNNKRALQAMKDYLDEVIARKAPKN